MCKFLELCIVQSWETQDTGIHVFFSFAKENAKCISSNHRNENSFEKVSAARSRQTTDRRCNPKPKTGTKFLLAGVRAEPPNAKKKSNAACDLRHAKKQVRNTSNQNRGGGPTYLVNSLSARVNIFITSIDYY